MECWYAVQVRTGREESVLCLSKKTIDRDVLSECFIPYYECMKRYQGEWHKIQHILFPGYVFFVSEQVDRLFVQLKKNSGIHENSRGWNKIYPYKRGREGNPAATGRSRTSCKNVPWNYHRRQSYDHVRTFGAF